MVQVQEGKVVLLKRLAHSSYSIKAIAPLGREVFILVLERLVFSIPADLMAYLWENR
jgi:hypothetical protein